VRPRTLRHGGRRLHAPHRTPPLRWSSIPARTVEPPPPSPPPPFGSPGPPRKSGGAEKTPPSHAAHRREANVDAAHRTNAPPMRESPVPSFSDLDLTAMATDMLPSLTEMPSRHGSRCPQYGLREERGCHTTAILEPLHNGHAALRQWRGLEGVQEALLQTGTVATGHKPLWPRTIGPSLLLHCYSGL
jgi:hypothetical protein